MLNKADIKKGGAILSFLLPSFIGFVAFILIPMIMAVVLSFTNYSGGFRLNFIGLKNYSVLFASEAFLSSLYLTFKYMVTTVVFEIVLGLAFALALYKPFRGSSFYRGVFYVPNILASVSVGLAFMFIFEPTGGFVNGILSQLGLPTPLWLAGEDTALSVIIFVTVWQQFGYYMVLFIGGLQNVNQSLYEAASMDGAGYWRRFFSITIPGISPILFFSITIAIIRGFQVFDYIFVMTGGQSGGGPAGATSVLAFNIYRDAFMHQRFGYASAESVVLMVIILIFTVIQKVGQKRWVSYDVV